MKLLHTYGPPTNLKKYTLDSTDFDGFLKLGLTNDTIARLQAYLQENSLECTIIETFDGASGWKGFEFLINGIDLSGNGFCFSENRLLSFLDK